MDQLILAVVAHGQAFNFTKDVHGALLSRKERKKREENCASRCHFKKACAVRLFMHTTTHTHTLASCTRACVPLRMHINPATCVLEEAQASYFS
eukprot:scaffold235760_cov19-Tisochrysis_lutea.AAC.1